MKILSRLRIAFSAFCAVACLLVTTLWIQSYFGYAYLAKRLPASIVSLQSDRGQLAIWSADLQLWPSWAHDANWAFDFHRGAIDNTAPLLTDNQPALELLGFRYQSIPPFCTVLFVPFWAMLLTVASMGVLPWVKWRNGLRAATSAVCLIAAVFLLALWARSYQWFDITDRASLLNICSMKGRLLFGETFMLTGGDSLNPAAPVPPSQLGICSLTPEQFQLLPMGDGVRVPYWLATAAILLTAATPWLRFRFSLRTMLVAMAVAAVLLFGVVSMLKR